MSAGHFAGQSTIHGDGTKKNEMERNGMKTALQSRL